MAETALHLYDPRRGDAALRVETFGPGGIPDQPQRFNLFTLLWLREGSGTFWADLNHYPFRQHDLLFFVPYQTLKLSAETPVSGHRI